MDGALDDAERRLLAAALPSYDIGASIGRGSWGTVVAARHRSLERDVAIKLLIADAGAGDGRAGFLAEARLLASLEHPHLVAVYDYVEFDSRCMLVMELMTGGSVGDLLRQRDLARAGACTAALMALSGLSHAHGAGVFHRDVKPDNLLISANGGVKVADFGIAMVLGDRGAASDGRIVGSPAYMAPEQLTGDHAGPGADIYSTATVLYELLAGRLPYRIDGDPLEVAARHVNEDATPLGHAAPGLPSGLASVVDRAISRSVAQRPADAAQFAREINTAAAAAWGPEWFLGATPRIDALALAHAGGVGPSNRAAASTSGTADHTAPEPGRRRHRPSRGRAIGVVMTLAILAAGGWVASRIMSTSGAASPQRRWVVDLAAPIVGGPVANLDSIFVGDDAGVLHSLDASSGAERWKFETGHPIRNTPVLTGGLAVFGGFDGYVHALDAVTGRSRWQTAIGFQIFASPAVVDDTVIVAADRVVGLDVSSGAVRWEHRLPAPSVSTPAIAGSVVVVGANDGTLRALDISTGSQRWVARPGGAIASTPRVDRGVVYVGSGNGSVHAYDVTTGASKWSAATGDGVNSSPLVVADLVIVGSRDRMIHAFDRSTGAPRWTADAADRVEAGAVSIGATIVVGDNSGRVNGVEVSDGRRRWVTDPGGAVLGSAALLDDGFVVVGGDGRVQRYELKS